MNGPILPRPVYFLYYISNQRNTQISNSIPLSLTNKERLLKLIIIPIAIIASQAQTLLPPKLV
jgi:hypothetical protein